MVRVEPKLSGIDNELLQLREQIAMDREYIATVSAELESYTQRIKITEVQIKEKDIQFAQLHRCRLCLAENLTPRSREKFVKRTTTKRFSGANSKAEVQEEQSPEELFQASLAAQESHTSVEGASKLVLDHTEGEKTEESKGSPSIEGDVKGGEQSMRGIVALPGEIIPGTAALESTKKISQAFQHKDGLHSNMPVQTLEDNMQKHPFSEILQRPATAPPRMDTTVMEVFAPLTEEENVIFQKQKLERKLACDLEGTSDDGEEIAGTEQEFKNLAASTIELLEHLHFDLGLASKIRVLLSRLRQLKKVGVQGAVVDDEEQDPSGEGSEMAADGEDSSVASKKKGKKGWGKMKKGLDPARRRSSQLEDMMSRNRRGSSIRPIKPKDLPFIPLAFGKLMKISPPPKVVKSFTEHQLTKLIQEIYSSKVVADSVDDAVDNERQSACEFVYDFMLNSYGLKGIAESAVHGIFKKIKQQMVNKGIEKTHKLRLFQRFCGYDPAKSYDEPDLYVYLKVMQTATSRPGIMIASELDDGINFINCGQIEHLLNEPNLVARFNGSREITVDFLNSFAASHSTLEKSSPEILKLVKQANWKKLDFDLLMEGVIERTPHKEVRTTGKLKPTAKATPLSKEEGLELEALFVAGDANQDGVLTFSEFREILRAADSTVSHQIALRMFREILCFMPDGGDSISPSAFATVAHAHGIKAPPPVVFSLLKKTWLQAQDDINPDKMKDDAQKREAEELKDAIEATLKSQMDSALGVQNFQMFVLKFCGGKGEFQGPSSEEGADDESE